MNQFLNAIALVAMLLITGACSAEPPPFDEAKAKLLTAEKRRAYDVVFFNEMETWNMNSNRYSTDPDFNFRRAEEFERMAAEGHFISWVALQLVDMRRGLYLKDENAKEALTLLIKAAESGDASSSCALMVTPTEDDLFPYDQRIALTRKLKPSRMTQGHPACKAYYGRMLLLGNITEVPQDRKAALPLLFDAAREGYFVASTAFFYPRKIKVLDKEFDFTDIPELDRALCWGRLAAQHTNWVFFDDFVDKLRDYARKHDRPDLIERSRRFDPRVVPITQAVVTADDCIPLEQGE